MPDRLTSIAKAATEPMSLPLYQEAAMHRTRDGRVLRRDLQMMLSPVSIEATAYRVPIDTPVRASFGVMRNRPAVIARRRYGRSRRLGRPGATSPRWVPSIERA